MFEPQFGGRQQAEGLHKLGKVAPKAVIYNLRKEPIDNLTGFLTVYKSGIP